MKSQRALLRREAKNIVVDMGTVQVMEIMTAESNDSRVRGVGQEAVASCGDQGRLGIVDFHIAKPHLSFFVDIYGIILFIYSLKFCFLTKSMYVRKGQGLRLIFCICGVPSDMSESLGFLKTLLIYFILVQSYSFVTGAGVLCIYFLLENHFIFFQATSIPWASQI